MGCWVKAETWGTDHRTYPSKTVEEEETLGKRTMFGGIAPIGRSVLGDLKRGPDQYLIGGKA